MRWVHQAKRQIAALLAASLLGNGLILPMGMAAELPSAAPSEDIAVPANLQGFSRFLWSYFLAPEPSHGGADTFAADYEQTWKNQVYGYGFFVYGLRDLVENSKFLELAKKGRAFRSQYWLDLVNQFLTTKPNSSDNNFNLNPFPELITSLRDYLSIKHGSGLRPIDYISAQNSVRKQIEDKYLSRTGDSWRTWYASDPTNKIRENKAINGELETKEMPGAFKLDFQRWKIQQLTWLDEMLLKNYRNVLGVLLDDYEVSLGLHNADEVMDPWSRKEQGLSETVPAPKFRLSRRDLDNLKLRVDHDEKSGPRIIVSLGNSSQEYVITVKSPQRGQYLGPYYFLSREYTELRPVLPLGLFDLMYYLKPVRHFKFDGNHLALGMQSDLADKLNETHRLIAGVTEAGMGDLDLKLKELDDDYKKSFLNMSPDALAAQSRRLGGQIAMDKWFDTDDLVDFIWYGYAQSDGFRHWRERDLDAFAHNKVALGQVEPKSLMPLHMRFRGLGLLKWILDAVVRLAKAVVTIGKGSATPKLASGIDLGKLFDQLNLALGQGAAQRVRRYLQVEAFRLDQPFPGAPIPEVFELPNMGEFSGDGVRPIILNGQAKADLVVESLSGVYESAGYVPVPRARSQNITGIRVYDNQLRELKPGADYELIEQVRTGSVAIKPLHEGLGSVFKYTVQYQTHLTGDDPPEARAPIDLQLLRNLAAKLKQDGHLHLSDAIGQTVGWAETHKATISIRDIERVLKENAYYSLNGQRVNTQGVTCYACADAARLGVQLVALLYASQPGVRVEERSCLKRSRSDLLRQGDAHARMLVSFPNSSYFYLDTTPANEDPEHPLPADIRNAWTNPQAPQENMNLNDGAAKDTPALKNTNKSFLKSPTLIAGAAAVSVALIGAKVFLTGGGQAYSPTGGNEQGFLDMMGSIPVSAYVAVLAALPSAFLLKHLWTKWQIRRARPGENLSLNLVSSGIGAITTTEENPIHPAPDSEIKVEIQDKKLDPSVVAALELLRGRVLDLYKDLPKNMERKIEPSDPLMKATRLSNLLMEFLSGQQMYSNIRTALINEFDRSPEAVQGAHGILIEFGQAAEKIKSQVEKYAELVRTRQEVRRGLHYQNPVLRRSVERILDSITTTSRTTDVAKLFAGPNCALLLEAR